MAITGSMVQSKPCVLVADDDPAMRSMVRRSLLRELDVDVLEAADGLAALRHVDNGRVDLLVVDVSMPHVDGFDTIDLIRRSGAHASLPVLVLSGDSSAVVVCRMRELGVRDFLAKPAHPWELSQRCHRLLSHALVHPRPSAVELTESSRVLIVDASCQTRRVIREAFASMCRVEEADSSLDAMRRCVAQPPDLIVLGTTGGLMNEKYFERRHAITPTLQRIPMIQVQELSERMRDHLPDAETCLPPTYGFVTRALLPPLKRTLGVASFTTLLLRCDADLFDTFCTLAGETLAGGLELQPEDPESPESISSQRHVQAHIGLTVPNACVIVSLSYSYGVAVMLASHRTAKGEDRLSDDSILSVITIISSAVADILARLLEPFTATAHIAPPRVQWVTGEPALSPGHLRSRRFTSSRAPGAVRIDVEVSRPFRMK